MRRAKSAHPLCVYAVRRWTSSAVPAGDECVCVCVVDLDRARERFGAGRCVVPMCTRNFYNAQNVAHG